MAISPVPTTDLSYQQGECITLFVNVCLCTVCISDSLMSVSDTFLVPFGFQDNYKFILISTEEQKRRPRWQWQVDNKLCRFSARLFTYLVIWFVSAIHLITWCSYSRILMLGEGFHSHYYLSMAKVNWIQLDLFSIFFVFLFLTKICFVSQKSCK